MFDPPIQTIGVITKVVNEKVYNVSLPNGKIVVGHVPKSQKDLHPSLIEETRVRLELTPYDLEKARIVGVATD
ncbi:MAG: translation initiation factor IF-1 [Myxococcota bacterium]